MENDYFRKSKYVTELSKKDFDGVATWALKYKGCAVVMFYADWCPWCKKMKNTWEKLGKMATFIKVCALNGESQKGHLQKIKEDMPSMVTGFPTFILYRNGQPIEQIARDDQNRSIDVLLEECMRFCYKK